MGYFKVVIQRNYSERKKIVWFPETIDELITPSAVAKISKNTRTHKITTNKKTSKKVTKKKSFNTFKGFDICFNPLWPFKVMDSLNNKMFQRKILLCQSQSNWWSFCQFQFHLSFRTVPSFFPFLQHKKKKLSKEEKNKSCHWLYLLQREKNVQKIKYQTYNRTEVKGFNIEKY